MLSQTDDLPDSLLIVLVDALLPLHLHRDLGWQEQPVTSGRQNHNVDIAPFAIVAPVILLHLIALVSKRLSDSFLECYEKSAK